MTAAASPLAAADGDDGDDAASSRSIGHQAVAGDGAAQERPEPAVDAAPGPHGGPSRAAAESTGAANRTERAAVVAPLTLKRHRLLLKRRLKKRRKRAQLRASRLELARATKAAATATATTATTDESVPDAIGATATTPSDNAPGTERPAAGPQASTITACEAYLHAWAAQAAGQPSGAWKFSKRRQTLLLAHAFDERVVSNANFSLFLRYAASVRSAARDRLLLEARRVAAASEAAPAAPSDRRWPPRRRARKLLRALR